MGVYCGSELIIEHEMTSVICNCTSACTNVVAPISRIFYRWLIESSYWLLLAFCPRILGRWQGPMSGTVSFCECTFSGGATQRWWGLVVSTWYHDRGTKTSSFHCSHSMYHHTRMSQLVKLSLPNILYLYPFSGHVISSIPLRSPVTFAFNAHFGPVYSVDSSPYHRNLFITCSSDNTARVYSMLQVRE